LKNLAEIFICKILSQNSYFLDLKQVEGDYAINYADGRIAFRVYGQLMPDKLTDHFFRVAHSYRQIMYDCQTRAAQTLHLGAKEYTPPIQHQSKMGGKRIWRQDSGVLKEHTIAILPELLFANALLKKVTLNSLHHHHCHYNNL
jgi:hypothetical protein